jgi:hypothetical protein
MNINDRRIQMIIVIIVSVLVAGGGVFFWQQSVLKGVKAEKDALQQQLDEFTKEPERYVKIFLPNGGEQLCLGENFLITWLSRDVNSVNLEAVKLDGSDTTSYPLGLASLPTNAPGQSTDGDFYWEVGKTLKGTKLKEGDGYKIKISSADNGDSVSDTSDGVFQILNCRE